MPKPKHVIVRSKDLMVSPPLAISEDATIDSAAELMWEKNVGSLIVVDKDGKIAGIFTEKDVVFSVTKQLIGRRVPISSIMSRTAVMTSPNESLVKAIEKMRQSGVRHLPVVDKVGSPVGMLSMRDALDISGPLMKFMFRSKPKKLVFRSKPKKRKRSR